MSETAIRLALEIATYTPEQLHVLRGLVDACHSGAITTAQADWQARLEALTAQLRRDFAEKNQH